MSASDGGSDWIAQLNELSSVDNQSLQSAVTKLIIAPMAAFFLGMSTSIEALWNLITIPVRALGVESGGFVEAVVGGASNIVSTAASVSATEVSLFGVVAFPAGIAIAGVGALTLAWFLQRRSTSDIALFTVIDVPGDVFGSDEDEG